MKKIIFILLGLLIFSSCQEEKEGLIEQHYSNGDSVIFFESNVISNDPSLNEVYNTFKATSKIFNDEQNVSYACEEFWLFQLYLSMHKYDYPEITNTSQRKFADIHYIKNKEATEELSIKNSRYLVASFMSMIFAMLIFFLATFMKSGSSKRNTLLVISILLFISFYWNYNLGSEKLDHKKVKIETYREITGYNKQYLKT